MDRLQALAADHAGLTYRIDREGEAFVWISEALRPRDALRVLDQLLRLGKLSSLKYDRAYRLEYDVR